MIFTGHKPLICAFRQKLDKCSTCQFQLLEYIGQFSTDICHISGDDNAVADTLSRIEAVAAHLDLQALAESQTNDEELQHYLQTDTGLQLQQV
jgi:hypothetical protein